MSSPKKKHMKIANSMDTPDSVFSKKKKKHSKNKEAADEVFNMKREEAYAAVETPKKKKKSKETKEEAPVPVVSKTHKRRPSVEALPQVEIAKSPSKKRSRPEKESEFSQTPKKKLKKNSESSDPPSDTAQKKDKKSPILVEYWPQEDMEMLYSKMRDAIPKDDKLSFHTRQDKLDWNRVSFGGYSGEDCRKMWIQVTHNLRGYRLLSELLTDAEAVVGKPWFKFGKKESKQKHPDEPTKPLSAYMLFYLAIKGKFTAENPGLSMGALTKLIAEKYKALSPSERKKYHDLAAQRRKEYQEKLEIFEKNHPECVTKKTVIKRSRTPLLIFTEDRTKKLQNSGLSAQEIKEHVKEKWKNLSDKKRIKWIKKAAEEHRAHQEEVKEQLASNPGAVPDTKRTSVLSRKELEILLKEAGRPVKPPTGALRLFVREEFAAERERGTPKEDVFGVLSGRWKEMGPKERQPYVDLLNREMEKYSQDYEAYMNSLTDEHREYEELMTQHLAPKKKVEREPKPRKKKEPEPPKKPMFPGEPQLPPGSGYELFVQSFLKQSGLPASQAPKFWAQLPKEEKAKFEAKQQSKMDKYMEKFRTFLKSLSKEDRKLYKSLRDQNEHTETNGPQETAKSSKAQQEDSSESEQEQGSSDSEASSEDEDDAPKKKQEDSSSEELESQESEDEGRGPNSNVVITKPEASSSESDSGSSESDSD